MVHIAVPVVNISAGAPYNAAGAIGRVTGTTYLTGDTVCWVCSTCTNSCRQAYVHFVVARTRRAGARTCQGLSEETNNNNPKLG